MDVGLLAPPGPGAWENLGAIGAGDLGIASKDAPVAVRVGKAGGAGAGREGVSP